MKLKLHERVESSYHITLCNEFVQCFWISEWLLLICSLTTHQIRYYNHLITTIRILLKDITAHVFCGYYIVVVQSIDDGHSSLSSRVDTCLLAMGLCRIGQLKRPISRKGVL